MSQTGTISSIPGITSAELYAIGTDTHVDTADTVVPGSNDPTHYVITFGGTTPGNYRLVLKIGSTIAAIEPKVTLTANGWSVPSGESQGTGARTVTLTVNLAGLPVQGATVRLSRAGDSFVGSTNASGQVTFSIDDGTWSIAITKSSMSFTPTTFVVDSNESLTYSMTSTAPPTSTLPNAATGRYLCVSSTNTPQANVRLFIQMVAGPGLVGNTYDSPIRKTTSGSDGLAYFTDLIRGAKFRVWRNYEAASSNSVEFTVPPTGEYFDLPEIL